MPFINKLFTFCKFKQRINVLRQQTNKLISTSSKWHCAEIRRIIVDHTEETDQHLTPEIKLRLITPGCALYHSKVEDSPFDMDPYWAFYWPGGQVLARFILDHQHYVAGKNVIDVGSGCGAVSIASIFSGASSCIANDNDRTAIIAAGINADLNGVNLNFCSENVIGTQRCYDSVQVVALGDMFYDAAFAQEVLWWLHALHMQGKCILIGDPGRLPLDKHRLKNNLKSLCTYQLPPSCSEENRGFTTGTIWTF